MKFTDSMVCSTRENLALHWGAFFRQYMVHLYIHPVIYTSSIMYPLRRPGVGIVNVNSRFYTADVKSGNNMENFKLSLGEPQPRYLVQLDCVVSHSLGPILPRCLWLSLGQRGTSEPMTSSRRDGNQARCHTAVTLTHVQSLEYTMITFIHTFTAPQYPPYRYLHRS